MTELRDQQKLQLEARFGSRVTFDRTERMLYGHDIGVVPGHDQAAGRRHDAAGGRPARE